MFKTCSIEFNIAKQPCFLRQLSQVRVQCGTILYFDYDLALEHELKFLRLRLKDLQFQIKDELNTIRFGAHVDTYGLTMLMLDPEHPEGLQVLVKTPNGEEWVDVPYIENSIVINVGALLSRWTGEFIATE